LFMVALVRAQDCQPCGGCRYCVYGKAGNLWKDCGGNELYWTSPAGTGIVPYKAGPCQSCTTGRLNAFEPSTKQWGFVASSDLANCQGMDDDFDVFQNTTVGCPATGQWHELSDNSYLRKIAQGPQCGLLQPGVDKFFLQSADQWCGWCYGHAEGPICSGLVCQSPSCACCGFMECAKLV